VAADPQEWSRYLPPDVPAGLKQDFARYFSEFRYD